MKREENADTGPLDVFQHTDGTTSSERRKQTSVFKDARIDRLVTWLLGVIATTGIGLVIAFVNGLDTKFNSFDARQQAAVVVITQLQQDIAVLKDERREIAELKAFVGKLENRLHELEVNKK